MQTASYRSGPEPRALPRPCPAGARSFDPADPSTSSCPLRPNEASCALPMTQQHRCPAPQRRRRRPSPPTAWHHEPQNRHSGTSPRPCRGASAIRPTPPRPATTRPRLRQRHQAAPMTDKELKPSQFGIAITDEASPFALRSARNRLRRAVRHWPGRSEVWRSQSATATPGRRRP
jgi:hypothetical protein